MAKDTNANDEYEWLSLLFERWMVRLIEKFILALLYVQTDVSEI